MFQLTVFYLQGIWAHGEPLGNKTVLVRFQKQPLLLEFMYDICWYPRHHFLYIRQQIGNSRCCRVISHAAIRIYLSEQALSGLVKCGHYNAKDRYPGRRIDGSDSTSTLLLNRESWRCRVPRGTVQAPPDLTKCYWPYLITAGGRVTFGETKKPDRSHEPPDKSQYVIGRYGACT